MTFDIEAWTSDGRGSVTVQGPLMSGQLEQDIIDITCPHCASVSSVSDNGWSTLVCHSCKEEVERPDWLVPLGS